MNTIETSGDVSPASLPASSAQDSALQLFVQSMVHSVDWSAKVPGSPVAHALEPAYAVRRGESGSPRLDNHDHPEVEKILGGFSIAGGARAEAGARGATPPVESPSPVRTSDQPQIDPDHFADAGKGVLKKVDTDNSGWVTRSQLARAMQDPSFKGQDAQALVALYKNFDSLLKLSGVSSWTGERINGYVLDMYQAVEQNRTHERQESAVMKKWAHDNLAKFSTSGGVYLTHEDIDGALSNKGTAPGDREMLTLVKKHFDELQPLPYLNALTTKQFDLLDERLWKDDTADLMANMWGSCHAVANEAQKSGTAYDLYGGKDPLSAITPDGVRQGNIGDCYFEAVVAAFARSNPALLRDCIRDNKNGTYTVTFPGDKDWHITIQAPTEAELGLYNHGSSSGVWASVLEKAYGQYRNYQNWFNQAETPQAAADGGGQSNQVIELFTGKSPTVKSVGETSPAEMAKTIESAISSHKAIVAGINKDADWMVYFHIDTPTTGDKFYKWHEYSITGFAPDGHGSGMVEIRNPWGGTKDTPDGTIQIPLDKFMRNFSDITTEN